MIHADNLIYDPRRSNTLPSTFYSPLPPRGSVNQSPISKLPVELVGRVLDLTCRPHSIDYDRLMLAASLVCKAWRDPALERRWRSLTIASLSDLVYLATVDRSTTYRTREVYIFYSQSAGYLERLFARLDGVVRLEITANPGLAPFFLSLPALSSLTELRLENLDFPQNVEFLGALPTNLKTLTLGRKFTSLGLLCALLSSSRLTLKTISLVTCPSFRLFDSYRTEYSFKWPPFTLPSLKTLRVNSKSLNVCMELIPRAPALRHVEFSVDATEVMYALASVPSHVREVAFSSIHGKRAATLVIAALDARFCVDGGWTGLSAVRLSCSEKSFRAAAGSVALLRRITPTAVVFTARGEDPTFEGDSDEEVARNDDWPSMDSESDSDSDGDDSLDDSGSESSTGSGSDGDESGRDGWLSDAVSF